jgi:undecaprenyl pyrophosphate phosphatase UppP
MLATAIIVFREVLEAALIVGIVAAFISGILAIEVLLRYVRTRSFNIFVAYRFVLAAVVLAVFLTR